MRSESQKKADKKYMAENTKLLQARVKPYEEQEISRYCKKMNISKARFIVWACNVYMSSGTLPPESVVIPTEDGESESDNGSREE